MDNKKKKFVKNIFIRILAGILAAMLALSVLSYARLFAAAATPTYTSKASNYKAVASKSSISKTSSNILSNAASSNPAKSGLSQADEVIPDPGPDGPIDQGFASQYRKGVVSAGLYHTVLLNEDGQVYCWGDNSYGQLGIGTIENEESPVLVPDLVDIVMVQAGAYHTLALSKDGNVYAWGRNTFGQLGNGSANFSSKPERIDSIPPMKEISAGGFHSLALSIDGQVYAWGSNNEFQVGDVLSENITDKAGNTLGKRVLAPQLVVEADAVAISAGGNHSLYLNSKGEVYSWGSNKEGQLGDGSQTSRGLPKKIDGLKDIVKISAGFSHNLAMSEVSPPASLKKEPYQNLYVWGSDSDGQLGLGSLLQNSKFVGRPTRIDLTDDLNEENDKISLIEAGYTDSVITVPVIKKGKRLDSIYVWGNNTYGQLGIGELPNQNTPVAMIATSNGWTGNTFLPFQSIAIGGYHAVFLSVKGFVGTVGRANKGQLGNVSIIDSKTPIGVVIPDAISPEWVIGAKLKGTVNDSSMSLSWPDAKDNIRVVGYEISYIDKNDAIKTLKLGAVNEINILDFNMITTQIISTKAIDVSGNRSLTPLEFVYTADKNSMSINESAFSVNTSTSASINSSNSMPSSSKQATSFKQSTSSKLTSSSSVQVSTSKQNVSQVPSDESSIFSEGTLSESITEVTPEVVENNPDLMIWSPEIYGTIVPLEVPWNVDYVYGAGVVLPPKDYSWIIVLCITAAILVFFITISAISFRKRHQGKKLFKSILTEIKRKPGDKRDGENDVEKLENSKEEGSINDVVDFVGFDDAENIIEVENKEQNTVVDNKANDNNDAKSKYNDDGKTKVNGKCGKAARAKKGKRK